MSIIPKATTRERFYRRVCFGQIAGLLSAPNAMKQANPEFRRFSKVLLLLILEISNIHAGDLKTVPQQAEVIQSDSDKKEPPNGKFQMSLSIDNEFTSSIAQDFSDLQDKLKKSAKETVNESMQTIGKELKSSITDIFKVAAGSTPKNSSQANASAASASTGFAGDWNTSFGKMKLEVNGDSVRGTYQMGQELCQLEGKISGPEMVFNYTERSATGKGKFTLAPDGMSFSGQWLEDGSNQWKPWQGRRPSEAASKPWSKLEELVGTELMDANGNKVDVKSLQGKIIGLYFSAHWCGPCRQFTPKLVEFRNANTKDFEVIFVSADRSAADQQNYMQDSGMKWPAVPYQSEWKAILKERFSIKGIPALIIVDGKGNLISAQGRSELSANSTTALAKWKNFSPGR